MPSYTEDSSSGVLDEARLLEVSPSPCYPIIESGLSSTGEQFFLFSIIKLELGGQSFRDFSMAVLFSVFYDLKQW